LKASTTTNVVSALTARTQLGQIIRRATANNERFVVDRRGQPSVIIMSVKDYVKHTGAAPRWLREIQAASKRRGAHKLNMRQINAEIARLHRRPKKSSPSAR
jgi:PHD/YefM family antitoxin component YafN of YafNO toxin-antitoxin module